MVNWQSAAELAHDATAFNNLMHVLLGLYIWEWFTSLDFDFLYIFGKRKFRWPMIFYFGARYSMVAVMIGLAISLNVTTEINCQSLYTYNQLAGNFAIGLSSVNLSIRCMAVWGQNLKVVIPICIIIAGHWAVLLRSIIVVKAAWVPGAGCAITQTSQAWLSAIYIYTMCFDGIVTTLLTIKLLAPVVKGQVQMNKLTELVFGDGLIYFVIAFLSNTVAVIFIYLNLNAVMSVIAEVPAAMVSVIVACRVVRRLSNYGQASTSEVTGASTSQRANITGFKHNQAASRGVHVQMQMETFKSPDDVEAMPSSEHIAESDSNKYDHDSVSKAQLRDDF